VRPEVRGVGHVSQQRVHDGPDLPLVGPPAAPTEEQGRTAVGHGETGSAVLEPLEDRSSRGDAERNASLLVPLADDADDVDGEVDVVHVEPDELPHAHTRRVQQLEDRPVAQVHRVVVVRRHRRDVEEGDRGPLRQHRRKRAVPARRAQPQGRIRVDALGAFEPAEERPQ
jgi:hypothetical protein